MVSIYNYNVSIFMDILLYSFMTVFAILVLTFLLSKRQVIKL